MLELSIEKIKTKRIFQLSYEEIYFLYITLNYTQKEIAKLLNTDSSNICRKLKKENIIKENYRETQSLNQRKSKILITKEMLDKDYPNLSVTQISKKYNTSSSYIYNLLKKYDIKILKNGYFQKKYHLSNNENLKDITYEKLYDLYILKKISASRIGKIFNTDNKYIYRRLIDFNIKIRNKKEAFNTPEYKLLKRELLIKQIQTTDLSKFKPNYNKKSIPILENFAKKNGFNIQHAENGGEFFIEKYSYWVDGYDKENNIVIEYYEDSHKYKKEYDIGRINNIKKLLGCKIYIIHESGFIEIL